MKRKQWSISFAILAAVALSLAATCTGREQPSTQQAQAAPPQAPKPAAPAKPAVEVAAQRVVGPVVAGGFYPGDAQELRQMVQKFLAAAKKEKLEGYLFGLVSPHAGYIYSGPVAGTSYRQLEGRKYAAIVIMAPSHHTRGDKVSVIDASAYRTPLGDVPISRQHVQRLLARKDLFVDNPADYEREHSLEVQLPFLQVQLGQTPIVPMIIPTDEIGLIKAAAAAIFEAFKGEQILYVASSDLSHYLPYDQAVAKDKMTLAMIKDLKAKELTATEEKGEQRCCGYAPISVLLEIFRLAGGKRAALLDYRNSGDTAGDRSRVVGYGSVVFMLDAPPEPKPAEAKPVEKKTDKPASDKVNYLTPAEEKECLRIARETVEAWVRRHEKPEYKATTPTMAKDGACFVTLKKDGELRGCIGHIIPNEPLYLNVRNMAVAASSEDPRFPPVTPDEMPKIKIEVSVLTPITPVTDPQEVRVGTDGLIMSRGYNRGLLLPQVPGEFGWNREEFLSHTCRKAGMEMDCWKKSGITIEKFQAQVFGEQ